MLSQYVEVIEEVDDLRIVPSEAFAKLSEQFPRECRVEVTGERKREGKVLAATLTIEHLAHLGECDKVTNVGAYVRFDNNKEVEFVHKDEMTRI